MATIPINGYELSYTFNGVSSDAEAINLILIHGAGGQEIDWPMAWRSVDDLTRSLGLTPKDHSGDLDKYPIYSLDPPAMANQAGKARHRWMTMHPPSMILLSPSG